MGERRKARRYQVYLPLQVCTTETRPPGFHTAQLRDISRTGLYFLSNTALAAGTGIELTFALPNDSSRGSSVLVRASAKALRATIIHGELTPVYGIAASIDRIDLVRPEITNAA